MNGTANWDEDFKVPLHSPRMAKNIWFLDVRDNKEYPLIIR